jgi:hypothetical protein
MGWEIWYTIFDICAYLFFNNLPIRKQMIYKLEASSVESHPKCLNKIVICEGKCAGR